MPFTDLLIKPYVDTARVSSPGRSPCVCVPTYTRSGSVKNLPQIFLEHFLFFFSNKLAVRSRSSARCIIFIILHTRIILLACVDGWVFPPVNCEFQSETLECERTHVSKVNGTRTNTHVLNCTMYRTQKLIMFPKAKQSVLLAKFQDSLWLDSSGFLTTDIPCPRCPQNTN